MNKVISIFLTEDFQNRIRTLCLKVYEVEWSGILYYTVEETEDSIILTPIDLYLEDIGSKAATSFEANMDSAIYTGSQPDGVFQGLIHSHNTMSSFFSSTDDKELEDNTQFHNHYLSLIVNNKEEYVAKVGFNPTSYIGFNGKEFTGTGRPILVTCATQKEESDKMIFLEGRIAKIKKDKIQEETKIVRFTHDAPGESLQHKQSYSTPQTILEMIIDKEVGKGMIGGKTPLERFELKCLRDNKYVERLFNESNMKKFSVQYSPGYTISEFAEILLDDMSEVGEFMEEIVVGMLEDIFESYQPVV